MKDLLTYKHGDTFLHRAHPIVKVLAAIIYCVCGFVAQSIYVNAALLLGIILLGFALGLSKRVMTTLKGVGSLCLFLFVIQLPFIGTGKVLVRLPLGLQITSYGLIFCSQLAMRLLGATLPLVVMLAVTRLSDLTNTIVQTFRVPYRYAFVVTTAIRFIPLLIGELADVIEAQTARGVDFDCGIIKKIKLLPPLCVPLLVSCVSRMETNALAAETRGFYQRDAKSAYKKYRYGYSDVLLAACMLVLLVACVMV